MVQRPTQLNRRDQATALRELARGRRATATTIAVMSGKGGVGKSNIAVNLSISLSSRGLRVVLVDVDMGLANADVLMNVQPRYTLSHMLSGVRSIAEVVIEGPGGVRFIPGASGLHELADLSQFERHRLIAQLQELEANTDIIVLDCGAGIGPTVMSFALAADRVMIVTTPQPTALTDAYATIKALKRNGCSARLCLVVNMVHTRSEAEAVYQRIDRVARKFLDCAIAEHAYMLHDEVVSQAVRERCPFVVGYPESNASACIAAMGDQVSQAWAGPQGRGGFFRRVVGLFL